MFGRFTVPRWILALAALAFLGYSAALLTVGFVDHWRRVDGATWSAIAVAVATLILALFTAAMAQQTALMANGTDQEVAAALAQADATRAQAEISTRALNATIRPWLTLDGDVRGAIDMSFGVKPHPYVRFTLKLRNIGAGLALLDVQGLSLTPAEPTADDRSRVGNALLPAVAPGERVSVEWFLRDTDREIDAATNVQGGFADTVRRAVMDEGSIPSWLGRPDNYGHVLLGVPYSDAAGGQKMMLTVHVAATQADGLAWVVIDLRYTEPPSDKPIWAGVVYQSR